MTDATLIYPAAPRIGWDKVAGLGRLTFGIGRRLDLPAEYGLQGDREFGWAGLSLGHCYAALSWR